MALPKIGDGEQVGDGNTGETLNVGRSGQALQVGGTAATLVAFHGAAPVDQAAFVATIAKVAVTGGVGWSTSAEFSAFQANINSILALLIEKGLMAAS